MLSDDAEDDHAPLTSPRAVRPKRLTVSRSQFAMHAFSALAPSTASSRVSTCATGATSRSKIGTLSRASSRARTVPISASLASIDADFAAAASGEWEGHRVYFDARGTPEPIPEKFMPPAFQEWGQVLVDWQSQCAMNVTPGEGIYARELRFIPTAGCEADSSTVETQEDRVIGGKEVNPAPAVAGASKQTTVAPGSYNSGPTALDPNAESGVEAVVEHCLGFDDAPKREGEEGKRMRVRVQQRLRFSDASKKWTLAAIVAWKEFYYEPFNNAASLCASCGGPNKWGEVPALPAETFTDGVWEGDAWAGFGDDDESDDASSPVVHLPAGVYSEVRADETTGAVTCAAGWFVPDRDASYLPPSRETETHLASSRAYGADGRLVDATFTRRERKVA